MEYEEYLKTKQKKAYKSGFHSTAFKCGLLREDQIFCVKKALEHGRFALFQDCGIGKTLEMLEWSYQVTYKTGMPVLIMAPLAVVRQTIDIEAVKFGYDVYEYDFEKTPSKDDPDVFVINHDQIDNIDFSVFSGVVLDESSILKNVDGKTSQKFIEQCRGIQYKLACTATPSPNDHMELGMHSEWLGYMSYTEMLAMFFVHDGGETSKWRLRKHAENDFWDYVLSWSIAETTPKSLGFDIEGFELPEIEYHEIVVNTKKEWGVNLFGEADVSAVDLHSDLRETINERIQIASELVASKPDEQWLIWGLQNEETDRMHKSLDNCFNVKGSDTAQKKAFVLNSFARKEFSTLITKTKIAGFGMNYQNCGNMIFLSYDFSFEKFYQAVRRCYRYGRKEKVNVYIIIPKTQINVRKSILEKSRKHTEMMEKLSEKCRIYQKQDEKVDIIEDVKTDKYWLMHGDCVQRSKEIPSKSVDLTVFSPPFAELYVYSDKQEDMGNSKDYRDFEQHFKYLIPEIKRVLKNGRICAIHCMDLPIQKGKEGFIGLRDFSGMIIDWFTDQGFIYHSRATIWKNPVTEMQRTKALGLLHKQIKKDSSMSRVGIPDYILFFRNEGDNETPITHQDIDSSLPDYLPVDLWQKYASPVWYDIDYSRTLQYTTARDGNDEKHICPLQLDTIDRVLHLYSNEGETVFSPFGGIGSEGFESIKMNRKSISIELKNSYFKKNCENHKEAVLSKSQAKLIA